MKQTYYAAVLSVAAIGVSLCTSLPGFAQDILLTPQPVLTQTQEATATPSEDVFIPSAWPNQVTALRYDLQRTSYTMNPSDANRMSFLEASENLLNMHCLEISPERGFEKNDRPLCSKLIKTTLTLDPENPAATCAKDGMSAPSCAKGYQAVAAKPVTASSPALKDKDVTGFITAQNPEDSSKLEGELNNEGYNYSKKPIPEGKQQLQARFYDAFTRYCQQVAYEVDQTQLIPTPTVRPYGTTKPFEDIVSALNAPPAKTTPTDTQPTHRKLLPTNCFSFYSLLQRYIPDSYLLVCIDKGSFSPQCRTAYERDSRGSTKGTIATTGAIGKF